MKLYSNKERESTGAHVCRVFSLEVLEDTASIILNSWQHVALFLSPLAEVLGSLPKPPTTYSPLNLSFYPKLQKFRLVQTHLAVSGAKLSGLCNKPAA